MPLALTQASRGARAPGTRQQLLQAPAVARKQAVKLLTDCNAGAHNKHNRYLDSGFLKVAPHHTQVFSLRYENQSMKSKARCGRICHSEEMSRKTHVWMQLSVLVQLYINKH